ncbi:MAG TPA: LppX_LprAFG lipoprotein [Nocardioidaceae bacterium]|nr:LppX_LprAFG lipoprotein [Nocardioidaceae bacterium]
MTPRNRALAAVLLLPLTALAACTGESGNGDGDPADVLSTAKAALDETTGVHLVLEGRDLPKDLTGVVKAEGVATHQPGFEGDVTVRIQGLEPTIAIIAVDGLVHAILPFTSKYTPVDPGDYGAPDPAALMDPTSGISGWLTAATDVKKGDQTRDGSDVLTTYSGTLDGANVVSAIPSADDTGTFEVSFAIDDEGHLRTATLTGPFYDGQPDVTYDVTITEYGTDKEISAP